MSVRVMARVWATKIQPTGRKLVALKLADACNDDGGSLFPSMANIAASCNLSRAQAQRHVHALINDGYLSVISNATGGAPGTVPNYKIHVDRLADPKRQTGSAQVSTTDSTDATGGAGATGHTDAVEGPRPSAQGAASVQQTGGTDATQPTNIHQVPTKEPKKAMRKKTSLPDPFGVSDQVRAWAIKKGYAELDARLEHFIGYAKASGATYADWDHAFMNAIRANWAKLPMANQHSARAYGNKFTAAAASIFGTTDAEVIDV